MLRPYCSELKGTRIGRVRESGIKRVPRRVSGLRYRSKKGSNAEWYRRRRTFDASRHFKLDPMTYPAVFLASILLEKNRWSNHSQPSVRISDWVAPAMSAGFSGIELWEFHWTRASADERKQLSQCRSIKVFNSYANLRNNGIDRRLAAANAMEKLGAIGIKFNFGPDPAAASEEIRAVNTWASLLPAGTQLWCECHSGTLAETPEGARRLAEALDPAKVSFIAHAFAEPPDRLNSWLDALSSRLVHIHVQTRDREGRWLMLKEQPSFALGTLNQLARAGFTGSYSIEFTSGVNTIAESPAELFAAACEDLQFIREASIPTTPH